MGKLVNEARERIGNAFAEQEHKIKSFQKELKLKMETLDVTVPGKTPRNRSSSSAYADTRHVGRYIYINGFFNSRRSGS